MAAESKAQKRKNTSAAGPAVKKPKTSQSSKLDKLSKNVSKAKTVEVPDEGIAEIEPAVKPRNKRKKASDFFDDKDNVVQSEANHAKKAKRDADADVGPKTAPAVVMDVQSSSGAVGKALDLAEDDDWELSDGDEEAGDQSAALLQGFESTSEEDGSEADDDEVITEVPAIPADKKLVKKLKSASDADNDGPGVLYVGRVPHGFYEHQMRAYFSQFGDINRLRLSRNKKTGQSKHYAFIEFASTEVAKIVAATMNKYLLFGHILQVRLLAPEEIHKDLFKGANKRFKVVPRNRLQGRQLRLPMERDGWERRIEAETKRRKAKEEKLMALGYEFKGPQLKRTKVIPIRKHADKASTQPEVLAEAEAQKPLPESESAAEIVETTKHAPKTGELLKPAATKGKGKSGKSKAKKAK